MAFGQPAATESFVARTWTRAEGLPNDSVTAVLQASDGFLWVGTQSGLVKFDGASFKPVGLYGSTNTGLRITDMCEDRQNRIWIGTEQLGLFCCSNGITRRIGAAGDITSPITALARGERNDLWVGTRKGLGLWNGQDLRWFTAKDGLPEEAISSICVASTLRSAATEDGRSGKVWITGHSGVYLYRDGQLAKYHFATESQGRSPEFLGVFEDQQRELWAFGDTYLIKLGEGRRFNYFRNGQISSARIWSFHEGRDGRLWIGTSGKGLFQFTGEGFRPVVLRNGVVPNDVRSIFQDRERNIWLGTDGGGLVQLRQERLRILGEVEGLPDTHASGIAQATTNQVLVSFLSEGAFIGDGEHFAPYGPPDLVSAEQFVHTLCRANNGDTWFGSASGGLLCLHKNRVVTFDSDSALAGTPVTYLQASARGDVWAGTLSGRVYACGHPDLQAAGSVDAGVTAMLRTLSDQLYVGTAAGSVWQLRKEGFVPVFSKTPPNASAITSLCEDSEGRIWVASCTNGLYCLHGGNVTCWPATQGLTGLRIYGLITDLEDNLWLTTSEGLALAEKPDLNEALESGTFTEPRMLEHLSISEVESGGGPSALRARDGSLWFILRGQVIHVDPRIWRPPKTIPAVFLESVRVNDGELRRVAVERGLAGSGGPANAVRLPAHVHGLDLQFTAPFLSSPERTRFRYRLEGLDTDWIEANPLDRRAHYGVIPSGSYCFRAIAANSEGVWNRQGVAFSFIVPIPLWRQPWVLTLEFATLAGVVAWIVRYVSHRRLQLRLIALEHSEEMSRERMRIAQDMHDEIGSKLARISYLSEVVKTQASGMPHAMEVVDSLAKTARDLLHSLGRMVWAVNPRNDSLENLASYLNRYAAEYFQNTPIRCQLVIPTQLPPVPLSAEVRHNIFLSFEEALTNAMKHSGATRVDVGLGVRDGRLKIEITDDGRGFDPATKASANNDGDNGLGLQGLQRRMQSIGGTCEIGSSPGQGTRVVLSFDLPQSHAGEND